MEKFEKFEIENQEMIYGGQRIPCHWTDSQGNSGLDVIDGDRIVYL